MQGQQNVKICLIGSTGHSHINSVEDSILLGRYAVSKGK
jgi:hypothetical protein